MGSEALYVRIITKTTPIVPIYLAAKTHAASFLAAFLGTASTVDRHALFVFDVRLSISCFVCKWTSVLGLSQDDVGGAATGSHTSCTPSLFSESCPCLRLRLRPLLIRCVRFWPVVARSRNYKTTNQRFSRSITGPSTMYHKRHYLRTCC